MKKLILIFSFCLIIIHPVYSQYSEWINYTTGNVVLSLANDGDFLWVGTTGGLVKLNTITGDPIFFNKTNSVLPENSINAIAIDSSGNKWFGTSGGLVKYDGTNWTLLNTSNSGLPINHISAIAVENGNILWIGTGGYPGGGLAKYNGTNWTVFNRANTQNGIPSDIISCLAVDHNGVKWIGTNNAGVGSYSESNWFTHYNIANCPIPSNFIYSLTIDYNGNKWIGTRNGLAKYDGTNWSISNTTNSGLPGNEIHALTIDESGNIWVGTTQGLAKFDGTNWTVYNTSNSDLPCNSVKTISIMNSDFNWIGSAGGGLVKFDGMTSIFYSTSNSPLPNNRVDCLLIDDNTTKWIGTAIYGYDSYYDIYISGLTKLDSTNWVVITESGIPGVINDIAIDSSENVWIVTKWTNYGLTKYDGTNFTHYNAQQDFGFTINAVEIDNSGNLWIAGSGLGKFDGVNWTFDHTQSATDLTFDKNGNLWATWAFWLKKFDGTNWIEYYIPSYPDYYGRYLAIDSIGNIWLTTYGAGLAKFNGTNWTVYNYSNSGLPTDYLTSVAVDLEGNIWVGTDWAGLTKFDGNAWTLYNTSNSGLTDNHINDITIDENDNIWIGTDNGLSVYNEGGVVSVHENKYNIILTGYILHQNYPNPFNPSTKISWQAPLSGWQTIKVFDVLGTEVKTLVDEYRNAGSYEVEFIANNLPSGVYFYQLKVGDYLETKKMILLK